MRLFYAKNIGRILAASALVVVCASMADGETKEEKQARCAAYAQRAVQQFQIASSYPQCQIPTDLRWQSNYDNHYNACMHAPGFLMKSEQSARDNHLRACGAPLDAPATNAAGPPSGASNILQECEGTFSSVWTWSNGQYSGVWSNGAYANLTVSSFTPSSVVFVRTDTSKSVTSGMTAAYTGTITSPGVASGSVTWTWPGHPGFPANGTWTMHFATTETGKQLDEYDCNPAKTSETAAETEEEKHKRCTAYAQRAVQQFQIMSTHPRCQVPTDLRWQPNYDNHYNACMLTPAMLMKSEQSARDNHLRTCGAPGT